MVVVFVFVYSMLLGLFVSHLMQHRLWLLLKLEQCLFIGWLGYKQLRETFYFFYLMVFISFCFVFVSFFFRFLFPLNFFMASTWWIFSKSLLIFLQQKLLVIFAFRLHSRWKSSQKAIFFVCFIATFSIQFRSMIAGILLHSCRVKIRHLNQLQ